MNDYVEDFRRAAHDAVDWAADYLADPRRYPVLPRVKPGELTDALPGAAPERGEPFEAILEDFKGLVVPAVTHWNHPGFMAYFGCTGSTPAVIAEMLAAAMNTNGILWKTSPAVTELEQVSLSWLRQWLGLPPEWFGIIYDTASASSMHALAAAREMIAPDARENGMPPGLVMYTSEQAHSSIEKGAITIGVGQRNVRKIGTDADFRMRPELLEAAIERDLAGGKRPFCIVATVGTTSTTSIDPVEAIAAIAEKHGLWLHVDAAYAGSAAVAPEFRHILAGVERAQSMVVNMHKWMFTPIDASIFFTSRPDILRRTFSLIPEYLRAPEDPRATNLMDYSVSLGRRFRALKVWFVMRYFGREGVAATIRNHICWAKELASWIDSDPQFERVAPVPLSTVCFRYKGTDAENQALLDKINADGRYFISHTGLNGRLVLRVAIGNLGTTREDVQTIWEMIRSHV